MCKNEDNIKKFLKELGCEDALTIDSMSSPLRTCRNCEQAVPLSAQRPSAFKGTI